LKGKGLIVDEPPPVSTTEVLNGRVVIQPKKKKEALFINKVYTF
jgi:hypothetical protein